jgi:3-phytase
VTYREVDRVVLPASFVLPDGTRWAPCNDPGDLAQVEGQVFDGDTLWMGQEDIGIWKVGVSRRGIEGRPVLVDRTREYGVPAEFSEAEDDCVPAGEDPGFGGRHLSADVEGLTVAGDRLLVSSQGDDTFAAYTTGRRNAYIGSFGITLGDDRVQESDGAEVVLGYLGPAFPRGLLVTQDGEASGPGVDPDRDDPTNFKFSRWDRVPLM